MKYKPQFKDLQFSGPEQLKKWLTENTRYTIEFEDKGQDLQLMWIHETGEILECDFHAKMFVGHFVNIKKVKIGAGLRIFNTETKLGERFNGLVVKHLLLHQPAEVLPSVCCECLKETSDDELESFSGMCERCHESYNDA